MSKIKYFQFSLLACIIVFNACDNSTEPDTTSPTVVITSPVEDATLSSATTIRVDATDDTGVEKVDFLIDGQTVATDTEEPWEHLWQVSYYADGETHSILAKASDGAENVGQSDLVHVFVSENAQETPIPQTPENYTVERNSNLIELSWTSINGAEEYIVLVSSSNEFTDTEYSITTSDTTVTTDALTDGMHYWKVRAKNSVGNYGEWSDVFTFRIGESSTSFQMVSLPGGTFEMGDIWGAGSSDELPTHQVTLSSFEISATEITNQQYADYLTDALAVGSVTATSSSVTGDWEGNNYEFLDLDDSDCQITYSGGQFIIDSGKENHPVIEVSWYGATGFAEYYGYRLPTEAEWEYASRGISAGEDNKWAGTSTESELTDYAWYYENWDGNYSGREVGTKLPNGNGLYDMSGNVWEWVSDWYGSYSSGSQTDPQGPNSGSGRIVRGGGYNYYAYNLRCSGRSNNDPSYTSNSIGFRISRTN